MNIMILTGIFPPDVGGPATYVPRLASHLHEEGLGVEVLCAGLDEADRTFPYRIHRVPTRKSRRITKSLRVLHSRSEWIDTLYVNGLELENYLNGFLRNTPSTQKIVGDRSWERYQNQSNGNLSIEQFQEEFPGLRTWFERWFHRTVTRASSNYIVPSEFLKSLIVQWGIPEDRINVIYNHSSPPTNIPEESVDWPGNGLKLLTVGRLVPWKRVPQLIRFMPEIKNSGLIVLGDGPEFANADRAVSESGVKDRVELKGYVDRNVVWQHLRDADVLLLNSTYEGFPHILLEAIESGTPAVVANSGGSRELAGFFPDRIRLYNRENPSALTDILNHSTFETFAPPSLPEPLQWETIADQTRRTLERTAG